MSANYDDPNLSKALELSIHPTTGLRARLRDLMARHGMTVALCDCHSPMMDHVYGKNRRLHRVVGTTRWCATCLTERHSDAPSKG